MADHYARITDGHAKKRFVFPRGLVLSPFPTKAEGDPRGENLAGCDYRASHAPGRLKATYSAELPILRRHGGD